MPKAFQYIDRFFPPESSITKRACTENLCNWYGQDPSTAWSRMPKMRWCCFCRWISTIERPRMASQVFQVPRLQENTGLDYRLRWTGQRCVLQDLLRQKLGSSWLRICLWFGFLTNWRFDVSLFFGFFLADVCWYRIIFSHVRSEEQISNSKPFYNPDTTSIKAPAGQGCPRCGGAVFEAEKQLAKGECDKYSSL